MRYAVVKGSNGEDGSSNSIPPCSSSDVEQRNVPKPNGRRYASANWFQLSIS
jgi:hypothetical protein